MAQCRISVFQGHLQVTRSQLNADLPVVSFLTRDVTTSIEEHFLLCARLTKIFIFTSKYSWANPLNFIIHPVTNHSVLMFCRIKSVKRWIKRSAFYESVININKQIKFSLKWTRIKSVWFMLSRVVYDNSGLRPKGLGQSPYFFIIRHIPSDNLTFYEARGKYIYHLT